ncbi:Gamma-glutamyltranspeptidase [Platysternon megacephalum]|uniref:Gamma-glutamyltranspeptidase n=1 Tax=Platysternon megacephalum TaxID=55544 RepID=A0A4D9DBP6_9SAUR|nr:Gamma-glutamyltranspeptidase [Platysternon megacephalum]
MEGGQPPKHAVQSGRGGAVASADEYATRIGLKVLDDGGTAADAAVATAAALGLTEPMMAGVGGGGFFTYYDASTGEVSTIDGRETAPAAATPSRFVKPDGTAMDWDDARVSGMSVGVPGTVATWQRALDRWGSFSLRRVLEPAARLAERGFTVDATFRGDIDYNKDVFAQFTSSRDLYLPGGALPEVGSTFRNPDLARTYRILGKEGPAALYAGEIGADVVKAVTHLPLASDRPDLGGSLRPGDMTAADLAAYTVRDLDPTHVKYKGYDVYGMGVPSSGGVAVGQTLGMMSSLPRKAPSVDVKHRLLEASALAFADRNRYMGGDTTSDVVEGLLDRSYVKQRGALIDPAKAAPKPVAPAHHSPHRL